MKSDSRWPLTPGSVRFIVPDYIVAILREHPLCRDLYPTRAGYYRAAAGHSVVREHHHDHLLIYCMDGAADLWVEGRPHRVCKGDLLLLPRDCVHAYAADAADPWTIFWVHFEGSLSDAYIDNFGYSFEKPTFPLGLLPRVIADFEVLLAVRRSGFSSKVYIHVANHLRRLLTYIAVQIPKLGSGGQSLNLDEIHGFMMHHLHGQLELDQMAAHVNLSRFYFAKRYRELTGQSPIQQFIRYKMEHAEYLLDTTSKPVAVVARALGYEDAYYFSRLFKKTLGMSPRAYRQLRGHL